MSKLCVVAFASAFVLLYPANCFCQVGTSQKLAEVKPVLQTREDPIKGAIAWLNQPWSGDDAQYAGLRRQIEAEQADGGLDQTLKIYAAQYHTNPSSNIAQFAYFYALDLVRFKEGEFYSIPEDMDISAFTSSLNKSTEPNTYNFTRMAALTLDCWGEDQHLYPFLQRLVQRDPNDLLTAYYVPGMLADFDTPQSLLQATKAADSLVAKFPQASFLHIVRGYAYYKRWRATNDKTFALQARQDFAEFLKSNPGDAFHGSLATGYIQQIDKGL